MTLSLGFYSCCAVVFLTLSGTGEAQEESPDTDTDGLADWVEYLLGRDHQRRESSAPLIVKRQGNEIFLDYGVNALAIKQGRGTVTLEASDALDGAWQALPSEPIQEESLAVEASRFYRLRVIAGEGLPTDVALPNFDQAGFVTLNGGCTGGSAGGRVTPRSVSELAAYCEDSLPRIIVINQPFDGGEEGLQIDVGPNKSLVGIGDQGRLTRIGLNLGSGTRNVIIRNLSFSLVGVTNTLAEEETGQPRIAINDGDTIRLFSMEEPVTNVWIDHCEFSSESPLTQANGELYDGLVDVTFRCQFITISWCVFRDHNKSCLVGGTSTDVFDRKITFHHNWFENVKQRTPSYRGGIGHVFNNYFDSMLSSGLFARARSAILVERNHFFQCQNPLQNEAGAGGRMVENLFENCTGSKSIAYSLVFMPYPYGVVQEPVESVQVSVRNWAGVGKLADPLSIHVLN